MARSLHEQSKAVLRSLLSTHNRNKTGKSSIGIRTYNDYAGALARAAASMGVGRLKHITVDMANSYLAERRDSYASQATLNMERGALAKLLGVPLRSVKAIVDNELNSRAYNSPQISMITDLASPNEKLAFQLAEQAGLRARELATLRRVEERSATKSRTWNTDRFTGRTGIIYTTAGKGGLVREVLIPHELHLVLEKLKLDKPKEVWDRKVKYLTHYDIPFGQGISQRFSEISKTALGFSNGIHGLRHTYAQRRLDEITYSLRCNDDYARLVLSQELGHFRPDVTLTYLR